MKTKTVKRGNRRGSAPASGAVFRALAENPNAPKRCQRSGAIRAPDAGREARPTTPGAGGLPKAKLWQLRLYVAGQTPRSQTAFRNLHRICEEHLKGCYQIEVVDLLKNPLLCKGDQILAIPTLVRKLPKPVRKIIGDLSDTDRVLVGLNLIPGHRGKSAASTASESEGAP